MDDIARITQNLVQIKYFINQLVRLLNLEGPAVKGFSGSFFKMKEYDYITPVCLIIIPVCLFILDKSAGEYSYYFDHKFVSN